MASITENLAYILDNLSQAAFKAGRGSDIPKLIAVSKTHGIEAIREALDVGQKIFGENRVQEATAKFIPLRQDYPDLELHLIGPLQTNKVEAAIALFDVIQTIDRPKLAQALATAILKKPGRKPRLYAEVNIGREPQKAGILPEALGAFLHFCVEDTGLNIEGLMCIPPQGQKPQTYFEAMKRLRDFHHLEHLSMGMSADYVEAIASGATEVRIGSAIFGSRLLPQI